MVANIDAAVEALTGVQRIQIVASDLPLLTAAVIEHFLTLCREDADIFYPIVPQAVVESRYPGARKTYVKVTDGTFTGGSVLLFGVSMLDRIRPLVEQVIAGRKNPVLLAKLFGGATLFKFFAGRLSIAELEARAYEIARIRGRAVVTDRPEIALDVDAEQRVLRHALTLFDPALVYALGRLQ